MNYSEFIKFIESFLITGKYPTVSAWPDTIELTREFNILVQKLYDNTRISGLEHEVSAFYIDADIMTSNILKGERNQVKVKHEVNLAYVPQKSGQFEKQIYVDGKVVKKILTAKVPSRQIIKHMLNIHTHPLYKDPEGTTKYSFFSIVDMQNFIRSDMLINGLITDKFWLACKTEKTIRKIGSVGEEMLYSITQEIYEKNEDIEKLVLREMKNWGIVFYRGNLNNNLSRIN